MRRGQDLKQVADVLLAGDRVGGGMLPTEFEQTRWNIKTQDQLGSASMKPGRFIVTLGERLPHATQAFGRVPFRDLERMAGELASWQAKLPERSRYGIVQALRQTLEAAVRWLHEP